MADTGAMYEWNALPKLSERFDRAEFRVWVPECEGALQGATVILAGTNDCSLHVADDPVWRGWATSRRMALVGALLFNDTGSYDRAEEGSGRALVEAVAHVAAASGRAELASVPLYLVGFSQGGQLAYHFSLWAPDRVGAFVTLKGGRHRMPEECRRGDSKRAGEECKARGFICRVMDFLNLQQPEKTGDQKLPPGLLVSGGLDSGIRKKNLEAIAASAGTLGLPWVHAEEPGTTHEPAQSVRLAVSFFERCLGLVPEGEWERRLGAFWRGEKLDDLPDYPLQGRQPTAGAAGGNWPQLELGPVDVREVETMEFTASAPTRIEDAVSLEVVPDKAVLEARAEKTAQGWRVVGRLHAGQLPLGLFKGRVRLYPSRSGQPEFGFGSVGIQARVVGGVKASPPSLFFGGMQRGESRELVLTVARVGDSGELEWLGVDGAVPGVSFGEVRRTDAGLELPVRADGAKLESGKIMVRVRAGREWVLAVPVLGASQEKES